MAALGSTTGASLVPDLTQSLNLALQTFGTPEIRAERERVIGERETEAERQKSIQKQLEIIADPGATPTAEQAALTRLGGLDPVIANATRATVESGDKAAQDALRSEAEKGARLSKLISDQPDFGSQQRALTQLGQEAIARGESPDRIIELQNMDEDRLGLELQKMQIAAQDIQTILTPAAPLTSIAKARADLNAGLITQSDFKTITETPKEFQTDVGKALADQQIAIDVYGPDSVQAEAMKAVVDGLKKGEKPDLSDIKGIRGEFTKLSGDFIKLRDAIGKVRLGAENPSAAGDIAMIFNFMKINDPGSTVREGEFATAQNAAGVPERIKAQYNQILRGERLTQLQRQDFLDTSILLFEAQTDKQRQLEESFADIAERANIKREDVVIDFIGDKGAEEEAVVPVNIPEGTTATNATTGEKIIFRNGQWQVQ